MNLKFLLLITNILLNTISAQEYYHVNKSLITKDSLNIILIKNKEIINKTSNKNYNSAFKTNRIIINEDSIINYGNITFLPKNFKQENIYTLINKDLPKFSLKTLDGNIFTNDSLLGKPTIINLWFTTCPPCISEIPLLNDIKEQYGDKLNYLAITYEDKSVVKKFIKKHLFTFDILINGREFLDNLDNGSFPKLLVIDKNNIIRYIDFGLPDFEKETNNQYTEFINTIEYSLKKIFSE